MTPTDTEMLDWLDLKGDDDAVHFRFGPSGHSVAVTQVRGRNDGRRATAPAMRDVIALAMRWDAEEAQISGTD